MKNQYFGDVNDYVKYGLLRTIREASGLRLGVCWMLTPDDNRADGRFLAYLDQGSRWRNYDPALFDELAVLIKAGRRVDHVRTRALLGDCAFAEDYLPDDRLGRAAYFKKAREALSSTELVFFDPDNGIEIASCRPGRKNSNKFVGWTELNEVYSGGASVLVYQHFRREERHAFISRMVDKLKDATAGAQITCFRTANVAFLLAAQAAHDGRLRRAAQIIDQRWGKHIQLWGGTREAKSPESAERI